MRPLVMDFRADTRARAIADQYMFGPAFLVSPVTTYSATSRSVYLPQAPAWYDFWTGTRHAGGSTIAAALAPIDAIPLVGGADEDQRRGERQGSGSESTRAAESTFGPRLLTALWGRQAVVQASCRAPAPCA
jgi:alpha-glucosidase (family GH31 glycosyl hydrolase)